LENGEFLKVGSSATQKTDVRIVAATNVKIFDAIEKGKFREDLYYRLSTVEIDLPPLRERKEDIHLLFRKFASDFAMKYKMPTLRLDESAVAILTNYRWSGNIRQLRNIAEQISVLEKDRNISSAILRYYLPDAGKNLPAVIGEKKKSDSEFANEREILYKVLFDMKNDLSDLKKLTNELMENGNSKDVREENPGLIKRIYGNQESNEQDYEDVIDNAYDLNQEEQAPSPRTTSPDPNNYVEPVQQTGDRYDFAQEIEEEESLSLADKEIELIKKSLERHKGKRKAAADDLGISERTLYRKIKQYDL
jgi:transcriptional regulator with PAS, ATPase and Fis domain